MSYRPLGFWRSASARSKVAIGPEQRRCRGGSRPRGFTYALTSRIALWARARGLARVSIWPW